MSSNVKKANKSINVGEVYGKYGVLIIMIVMFLAATIFVEGFFSGANLTNVLRQIVVVTILAYGATFIIILGHINIACGSLLAFYGCIASAVMVETNSVFFACLVGITMGAVGGWFYGFIVTRYRIPAFIMGLALQTAGRGAVLLFTNAKPITNLGNFTIIGQGRIGIFPISVIILAVLFAITWFLLNKTCFGRHIYAVGGNENAAVASGIKSNVVVIKAFILDGMLTGVSGIVLMSRLASGQPSAGLAYEFDAITAVVVGGTSLAGGSGSVFGTLIGAVIVGVINNVQNLMNVNPYWQQIVKGVIILGAVIIDIKTKRASSKVKA